MGPDGCPVEVKPGCGGFGIRNFLTLFLSIEVSKAMLDKSAALSRGDEVAAASAARRVGIFKEQLDESNPILTAISDAMTAEGKCLDKMKRPTTSDDEKARLQREADAFAEQKKVGNEKLMVCSLKYRDIMRKEREVA
mmetsp:Transcript_21571/g.43066  ORF Transcript_21571/g.43066 Transcript_21571/m.43066 type:complete len:138 (-) Transcript_21571:63-476(-)